MSDVTIKTVDEKKIGGASIFEEINALSEGIRERAYGIFEARGGDGSDREDWLNAERDLLCACESDLVEKPEPINLDKVTADLSKGVLHLIAAKAKQQTASKVKSVAA